MARADRRRRRSWRCRGRHRGAGVGERSGTGPAACADSWGGARGPAGVERLAERPPPPQSLHRRARGGGLRCAWRRRLPAGGRRRPERGEPCVTAGEGGESLWPGVAAASLLRGKAVLLVLSWGLGPRLQVDVGSR